MKKTAQSIGHRQLEVQSIDLTIFQLKLSDCTGIKRPMRSETT